VTALLEVEGLDVWYGNAQALRGVSLRVDAGELVALLGPNGAGKTTTLRAIAALVPARAGRVVFDGSVVNGTPPHQLARRGLAFVPEERDLFPSLTVEENLRYGFWARRRRGPSGYRARLDQVYAWFPALAALPERPASTLSGGEQQLLAVARALMPSPRLLIVDELSLGLAPLVVEQLFGILRSVNAGGTAVLLVEQFVHLALANTSRAYLLAKGAVQVEKPSGELLGDAQLVASYLGDAAAAGMGAGAVLPTAPIPPPLPEPPPPRPLNAGARPRPRSTPA
jgi:branched-chain amino acid transport system ATP-binding protein